MINEANEFCRKYDAQVGASTSMHRRYKRVMYDQWISDPKAFDALPYETVLCVEIHMPEDRFRALIEKDQWLERLKNDNMGFGYNAVDAIINQYEQEAILRQQHPGLLDLYEKYQTMLQLVK